jgi:hypothetical protein
VGGVALRTHSTSASLAKRIQLAGTFHHIQTKIGQRTILVMPEEETIERAREDEREGKAPSTQAGEFVREEIEHIREGEHGARSTKQAIAIGLSKARRAGVKLPPPKKGKASKRTRRQAKRDYAKGKRLGRKKPSRVRSRATKRALKREPRSAASHRALSRQAHAVARRRSKADRSRAAKKAARTRKRTR